MKLNYFITGFFMLCLAFIASTQTLHAQNDSAELAAADTTQFSINAEAGWLIYNSHVGEQGTDSVQLELIIRHDNNINWEEEHYIGKIKFEALMPQTSQTINYYLLNDHFIIRIDTTGRCYLRFVSGAVPSGNHVVVPIRIHYKK